MKPLTGAQRSFLLELLRWDGVASPQDLSCQVHQSENSARQTCKRRGYVTFDGRWRITRMGREVVGGQHECS